MENYLLTKDFNIEELRARGQVEIDGNLVSIDLCNGVASFRIINRKSIHDKDIIESINNKWISFNDYKQNELKNDRLDDMPLHYSKYSILLQFGYYDFNSLCFYIKSAIVSYVPKEETKIVEVFSNCLIDHFFDISGFNFNTNGYEEKITTLNICDLPIDVYKVLRINYEFKPRNFQWRFPKTITAGFKFISKVALNNDQIYRLVTGINEYCKLISLCKTNSICNVKLWTDNVLESVIRRQYYIQKYNNMRYSSSIKYKNIEPIFTELMSAIINKDIDLSSLYYSEEDVIHKIDILTLTSMFENLYRKVVHKGIEKYKLKEDEYASVYNSIVDLKENDTKLGEEIRNNFKAQRSHLLRPLKMQLQDVFDTLLSIIKTNREQIKDSIWNKFSKYNICDLATRIKTARNDIAHFLEDTKINYGFAVLDCEFLQLMNYLLIFELYGLDESNIKNVFFNISDNILIKLGIDRELR